MSADQPVVRIAGGPTPEETAVVVAVLTALGAAQESQAGARRSLWNARARAARPRLSPGPGAWKGSVLPR